MASMMPWLYEAHDAFQTLVNAAASQQSLAIPDSGKKDDQLKDKAGFFNHSALKFSRNPFTKEQFEKEIKSQELIKKQQQQQQKLADENAAKSELDNQASKIFSDSFQKDQPHPANMMTASGLIDAIIAHQINLPDKPDKPSASAGSFNASSIPSNYLNDHIKSIIDNCGPLATNQSINSLYLLQNVSTNPSLVSSASSSPSLAGLATTKASDDLMNENWKLRKALEQKEAAQRKESAKIESHIELEPISPPSTPTPKEQQLTSSLNLSASLKQLPWPGEMSSQLSSGLSALAQSQALSDHQSAPLGQQSSLSNLQLEASKAGVPDPAGFQKYFKNRIAQAMSTEQPPDKEQDTKKLKSDGEMKGDEKKEAIKSENKVAYSTPPPLLTEKLPASGLENISSLSELQAQRSEFQKQQQKLKLKEGSEKTD